MAENVYIAIDLKSFYASVECITRGLDPLRTNLVVADSSRTEKTICLAVSPSLKSYGIAGRARLFEVVSKVSEVNAKRKAAYRHGRLRGSSYDFSELSADPSLEVGYITAPPRMALYMKYSTEIYKVYLKYVAPEDIHVYSIDEVFIYATPYLKLFGATPREFAKMIIRDVYLTTGITATAGIGTNLYLAKVAMDIVAKHTEADSDGARIAELDEYSYRRKLWCHRPITDFWRVGHGYARSLEKYGIYTMGDVARCSVAGDGSYLNEELLYRLFGVNAELLIDHAWGYESATMADIKAYRPESESIGTGQVIHCPYEFDKAKLIVREMTDLLSLDLVERGLLTDQLVLTVGYDIENLTDPKRRAAYKGETVTDHYGRLVPKHAHGTANLGRHTSSTRVIVSAMMELFDRIVDPTLLVRRVNITANRVLSEEKYRKSRTGAEQISIFEDAEAEEQRRKENEAVLKKEKNMQKAIIDIKKKFGKNAILKGMNFEEGATTKERNTEIGGHKA